MKRFYWILFITIITVNWAQAQSIDISGERLEKNIKILASDDFEGRAPSTKGETLTIEFLEKQFKQIGFEPGNHGSYFQEISLIQSTISANNILVSHGGETIVYEQDKDIHITSMQTRKNVSLLNSELVFVGYGANAPEYNWNDYAGIDVKGKTVLILDNDPGHLSKDTSLFNGTAMTYYGRPSYKLEEALRQGAAAALIIHDTDTSSSSWETMASRFKHPVISLDPDVTPLPQLEAEGWIPRSTIDKLFTRANLDFEREKEKALQRGFNAYTLNASLSLSLNVKIEKSTSNNVIAVLPGSERPDETIFYVAHWDHFGIDETLEGDQIYNGARDNASGTASLLEIAQAFKTAGAAKRSIVMLASTVEERGLLGTYYYVNNPIYPINKTITVINIDTMNLFGRTKDSMVIGLGDSEMDQFVLPVLEGIQRRKVNGDLRPELGIPYRGDHFSFNRVGIPALEIKSGNQYLDERIAWKRENDINYSKSRYHKPDDEYLDIYDLSGLVENLEAMYLIGRAVAESDEFPNWYEGKEFKYLRDAHMKEIVK